MPSLAVFLHWGRSKWGNTSSVPVGDDSRCCQVGTSKGHFIKNKIRFVIDYFVSVSILVACNMHVKHDGFYNNSENVLQNSKCRLLYGRCPWCWNNVHHWSLLWQQKHFSVNLLFFVTLCTGLLGYLIHLGAAGLDCTLTFLLRFTFYWMVCSLVWISRLYDYVKL